jgi:hypothetical protein
MPALDASLEFRRDEVFLQSCTAALGIEAV